MAFTKRCFSSVPALKRLSPQVLRDLMALFPDFVAARGLGLPAPATGENLDYESIRDALMAEDVPGELDDILYLSSLLGDSKGWEIIRDQARDEGFVLPDPSAKLTHLDLAILAATMKWPANRDLLGRAHARARVHSRSAYVYYAPTNDPRGHYRAPDSASLAEAREALASHFIQQGLITDMLHGRGTEIIPYDFDKEIWFLIRYPDRKSRYSGCDRTGDWQSYDFNPEKYDAVAYNKVYADLRMNTKLKRDHPKYRVTFGRLMFGDGVTNVFRPKEQVVSLAPLQDKRATDLFEVDDIPGLGEIAPIEITYVPDLFSQRQRTEKAVEGSTLLRGNPYGRRVLPKDTAHVERVVFSYRLRDMKRRGRLTLQYGNQVNYERDGDSVVVERWLRRRGFVKCFVEVRDAGIVGLDENRALAVGE